MIASVFLIIFIIIGVLAALLLGAGVVLSIGLLLVKPVLCVIIIILFVKVMRKLL